VVTGTAIAIAGPDLVVAEDAQGVQPDIPVQTPEVGGGVGSPVEADEPQRQRAEAAAPMTGRRAGGAASGGYRSNSQVKATS
jgi:hypothetical protein